MLSSAEIGELGEFASVEVSEGVPTTALKCGE